MYYNGIIISTASRKIKAQRPLRPFTFGYGKGERARHFQRTALPILVQMRATPVRRAASATASATAGTTLGSKGFGMI